MFERYEYAAILEVLIKIRSDHARKELYVMLHIHHVYKQWNSNTNNDRILLMPMLSSTNAIHILYPNL